jgi:hypothetical protein
MLRDAFLLFRFLSTSGPNAVEDRIGVVEPLSNTKAG